MKVCKTCKEKLSDEDFYIVERKEGYNRLHPSCKSCVLAYNRERHKRADVRDAKRAYNNERRKNPTVAEAAKKCSEKFYESVAGRAKTLFKGASRRVVDTENFDITADWIESRISLGNCEVTGIPFDFSQHPVYSKNPYSPSIDRVDSTKDYTKDNVRFVIWQVNMMRGEVSDEEMLVICNKFIEGIKNGRCQMDC
jgi:hypothetical protein